MDPQRRELYVEGTRDRAFINWLFDGRIAFHASVVPIDLVEVPDIEYGGNRERLRIFLHQVAPVGENIKGLLDADQSRVVGEDIPPNAWLTDLRDSEGYVVTVENIDTVLRIGLGIERISADTVLRSMYITARYLSSVRLASYSSNFKLPISGCELKKYCRSDSVGELTFQNEKFLQAMMQEAKINLREKSNFQAQIQDAEVKLSKFSDAEVSHGKDCMKLLTVQFRALGATSMVDVAPLVWSSFKKDRLNDFPVLQEIETYLTAP